MRIDVIVLDFVHKHMYIFCFGCMSLYQKLQFRGTKWSRFRLSETLTKRYFKKMKNQRRGSCISVKLSNLWLEGNEVERPGDHLQGYYRKFNIFH